MVSGWLKRASQIIVSWLVHPLENFLTPLSSTPSDACFVALTIAGFDPSCGAGVTADIQVFAAHRLFGIAAITAHTVQSTQGVASVYPQDVAVLAETLNLLAADFSIAGIKIGMLGTAHAVETTACFLEKHGGAASGNILTPVVLDPVLLSSSGRRLLTEEGVECLRQRLLPAVDWITPNWPEMSALAGVPVHSLDTARLAAHRLAGQFPKLHIIVTGGDQERATDFLLTPKGEFFVFDSARIASTSTHGTGCAFSSALLAGLLQGQEPHFAVAAAKRYVEGAIVHAPAVGKGRGPLNFFWQR
jgi:hydroxymethylpyrimidine/phosphomethylpyrimidine kinase